MQKLALSVLTLLVAGCGRQGAKLPDEVEAARKLAAAPASTDPKVLVTDDAVSRHIVYQREMNPVAGIAVEVGMLALKQSGGNQQAFQAEMAKDPRVKQVADAEARAIAKSGLSRQDEMALSRIVADYTAGATLGDAEMKAKAREQFLAKYGPQALGVLEKRLPDLAKLQDETLAATLKPRK